MNYVNSSIRSSHNSSVQNEMPLLLRTVRLNRWLKQAAESYLAVNDVPADPFGDLQTTENLLSVWELADDRSNLERIVRAVAVGKQKIDHTGYLIFDSERLTSSGIAILSNKGTTADVDANQWHRDLVLSGNKLLALVGVLFRHSESGTLLKKRLQELVEAGIEQGELPDKLRRLLTRMLAPEIRKARLTRLVADSNERSHVL